MRLQQSAFAGVIFSALGATASVSADHMPAGIYESTEDGRGASVGTVRFSDHQREIYRDVLRVSAEVAAEVIEVQIKDRRVVAPQGTITLTQGDLVELRLISDEPVTVHLHGYDQTIQVGREELGSTLIEADATGRFSLTVHHWGNSGDHSHGGGAGHEVLTYVEVHPR